MQYEQKQSRLLMLFKLYCNWLARHNYNSQILSYTYESCGMGIQIALNASTEECHVDNTVNTVAIGTNYVTSLWVNIKEYIRAILLWLVSKAGSFWLQQSLNRCTYHLTHNIFCLLLKWLCLCAACFLSLIFRRFFVWKILYFASSIYRFDSSRMDQHLLGRT